MCSDRSSRFGSTTPRREKRGINMTERNIIISRTEKGHILLLHIEFLLATISSISNAIIANLIIMIYY